MAYHGYIPVISQLAKQMHEDTNRKISVLEIGVDTGISLFALNHNLSLLGVSFEYIGVDIKIQNHIQLIDSMFFKANEETSISLVEDNSLKFLPKVNKKFDIILLDGDHNYETVSQELEFVKNLMHDNTLVICDDYSGRWSNKDLYYINRPGYSDIELATPQNLDLDKAGVKPAIDEFVDKNNELVMFKIMQGEPILIMQKYNKYINYLRYV